MTTRGPTIAGLVFIALLVGATQSMIANQPTDLRIHLDPPGQREFILDKAHMISAADANTIKKLADQLLTDKAAPIVVVTIQSMSDHGVAGLSIETFARLLFDQWQIGPAQLGQNPWNKGILLLVSRNDRRARIELGAGWGHEKDQLCQQIMDQQIIPQFKLEDFSAGILAGVVSLEKMARGLALPSPPKPKWFYPAVIAVVGLTVFTGGSLARRGRSGWAWLFWGMVFTVLGVILYELSKASANSGGGSYRGGSFGGGSSGGGGGYSGGGGASGSW